MTILHYVFLTEDGGHIGFGVDSTHVYVHFQTSDLTLDFDKTCKDTLYIVGRGEGGGGGELIRFW